MPLPFTTQSLVSLTLPGLQPTDNEINDNRVIKAGAGRDYVCSMVDLFLGEIVLNWVNII